MAIFWYMFIAYISIFIHELGHYSSAYLFGIKANQVITGMGFKILSFNSCRLGTWYAVPYCLVKLELV